jgi:hypothetical protein
LAPAEARRSQAEADGRGTVGRLAADAVPLLEETNETRRAPGDRTPALSQRRLA